MNEDTLALAKLRAEELVAFFGVNTTAQVQDDDGVIKVSIESDANGRLIGYRGETLRAMQYILSSLVRAGAGESVRLSLDIAGYKQARAEGLEAKARETADKVLATGKDIRLRPMSAAERRIVHMALQDVQGVTSESEGAEPHRRLVIKKSEQNS